MPGHSLSRGRAVAAGLVAAVAAVLAIWLFAYHAGRQTSNDFASPYFAAQAVRQHENPYDLAVLKRLGSRGLYRGEVFPYLYTPFVCALVMLPFASMPYATALSAWFWFNAVLVLAGMFLLFRIAAGALPASPKRERHALVVLAGCVGLVLAYYPVAENFRWAQINPLIFFGLVLFIYFLGTGRDAAAGGCLAIIILIKIAPLLLLVYLVAARRYKAAGAAGAATVVLTLISVAVVGVEHVSFYVDHVLPAMSFGKPVPQLPDEIAGYPGNAGLNGMLSSLFVESMLGDRLPWRYPDFGVVVYYALCLALVVDLAARARRMSAGNGTLAQLLLIGNAVVVYSLVSPITSEHHLLVLAVPLIAVLAASLGTTLGRGAIVSVVCAAAILAMDGEGWYFKPLFGFYARHPEVFENHPVWQYAFLLVLPIKLYAMVVLWGATRRPAPILVYDRKRLEGRPRIRGKSSTHLHRSA